MEIGLCFQTTLGFAGFFQELFYKIKIIIFQTCMESDPKNLFFFGFFKANIETKVYYQTLESN